MQLRIQESCGKHIAGTGGVQGSYFDSRHVDGFAILLEQGTGYDFFSKRPLDQAITPTDRLYMRLSGSPRGLPPLVRQGINLIPGLTNPLSVAGGLADERLPFSQAAAKQAINALTGIKLQDVDRRWQLQDAISENADRLRGWTRTTTIESVPSALLPMMPQNLQENALLDRAMRSRLNRLQRAEREKYERQKRAAQ